MGRERIFDNWPYMRGWREVIRGDVFTGIEVGPSAGLIPIRRLPDTTLELLLIREARLETAEPIIKEIGTFLRGSHAEPALHTSARTEAGIRCHRLHLLVSKMEGFTVIDLPISTYLGLDWTVIGDGTAERLPLSLDEAVELVLQQRVADQTAADAIMRIALLEARNRLPL